MIQDAGEGFAEGVQVELLPGGTVQMTDVNGSYSFTGLAPGTYTVLISPLAGYTVDTPVGGSTDVSVDSNDVAVAIGLTSGTTGIGVPSFNYSPTDPTELDFYNDFPDPPLQSSDPSAAPLGFDDASFDNSDYLAANNAPSNPITYHKVKNKEFFDEKKGIAANVQGFKDTFGIDITNPSDNQKNAAFLLNVHKPNGLNRVTAYLLDSIRFDFNAAKAQGVANDFLTKNAVIQNVSTTVTWSQGTLQQPIIAQTDTNYLTEYFKINPQTNQSVNLDQHGFMPSPSGGLNVGPDSTKRGPQMVSPDVVSVQMSFQFGIGNYDNQAMPNDFGILYNQASKAPDPTKFNCQYGTGSYTVVITLTMNGDWTFKDESTGVDIKGNMNAVG